MTTATIDGPKTKGREDVLALLRDPDVARRFLASVERLEAMQEITVPVSRLEEREAKDGRLPAAESRKRDELVARAEELRARMNAANRDLDAVVGESAAQALRKLRGTQLEAAIAAAKEVTVVKQMPVEAVARKSGPKPQRIGCLVPDCSGKHKSQGFCARHAERAKKRMSREGKSWDWARSPEGLAAVAQKMRPGFAAAPKPPKAPRPPKSLPVREALAAAADRADAANAAEKPRGIDKNVWVDDAVGPDGSRPGLWKLVHSFPVPVAEVLDRELAAMEALVALDPAARDRVLLWAGMRYGPGGSER